MISSTKWKKNFFLIWSGQAVSQLTSSILQFAIVWYLTGRTASPWVLSMAMLASFLPRAILGPFIGVFIDRYNRKRIMILSDIFIAVVSFGLVIANWIMPNPPLGFFYLILMLRAVGTAFHEPCLQAVTPQIVPPEEISRCAGYSQSLESMSLLLSPALAFMLYGKVSLNTIILFDVVGALIASIALGLSHIPPLEEKRLTKFGDVIHEAAEGWQLLKNERGLLGLTLISTLYSLAMMPISTYFPLMAIDYFGGGEALAGQVEIVFAIGFLVASVVLSITGGTKNKIYMIVLSFGIMTTSLFVTGLLAPNQGMIFAVCAFFMGVSGPFFWGMYRSLLQQSYPPNQLGRVMSLTSSITVIASPIGMIISGSFAKKYGAPSWFTVAGFMVGISLAIILLTPAIRSVDAHPKGESI